MDVCPPTIKTLGSNEPRKFGVCFIQRLLDLLVSTSKVPSVIEGWGERRNTKAFGEEHQEYVMEVIHLRQKRGGIPGYL